MVPGSSLDASINICESESGKVTKKGWREEGGLRTNCFSSGGGLEIQRQNGYSWGNGGSPFLLPLQRCSAMSGSVWGYPD